MKIPNGYTQVLNVKAVIYDQSSGLFLFQSIISAKDDRWTLVGGEIPFEEGDISGLHRKVVEEIGVIPTNINPNPVFIRNATSARDRKIVTTRYYWTNIPRGFELQANKGVTETGRDYEFFQIDRLREGGVLMTSKTRDIVNAPHFPGWCRKYQLK